MSITFDSRPNLFIRCAQNSDDNSKLINVVFTRENRRIVEKLAKDAANRPKVHRFSVCPCPVQKLWCPVSKIGLKFKDKDFAIFFAVVQF